MAGGLGPGFLVASYYAPLPACGSDCQLLWTTLSLDVVSLGF